MFWSQKRKGGVSMTKLRTLNMDRAATEYLISLCKLVLDFRLDKYCQYADNYANTDGIWIGRLREQARMTSTRRAKYHGFKIDMALRLLNKEMPWVVNAKLGLADDLVCLQSLSYQYNKAAENCLNLKVGLLKELCRQDCAEKKRPGYELWYEDVCRSEAVYDNLLSDIITVYHEGDDVLKKLRREIISQAYLNDTLRKMEDVRRRLNDGTYLESYVCLRDIVQPFRRPTYGTFQYRLMEIRQSVDQRITVLTKNLSKIDHSYLKVLHDQEGGTH